MATVPTLPSMTTYPGWMRPPAGYGPTPGAGWAPAPTGADLAFQDAGWPIALKTGGLTVGAVDRDGGSVAVKELTGLFSTTTNVTTGERAWRDGAWVGPSWLGAKHVDVTVRVRVPPGLPPDALPARLDAVYKALPLRGPAPVVFRYWDYVLVADAIVNGDVTVEYVSRYIAVMTVPLLLPDPILSAADWGSGEAAWMTRTITGEHPRTGFTLPFTLPFNLPGAGDGDTRAVFTVTGAAPARVILRLDGPLDAAIITDDAGWQTTVNGRLNGGETLTIDPAARTVLLGGASRRAWLSGWPVLEPGEHSITWQVEGAGATTALHITYCQTTI